MRTKETPKHNKGFTLIETIIYITIFAFIMTGALVSVYGILGSNARNTSKAMLIEEGVFLIGKIDWVLSGVQSVNNPVSSGDILSVIKSNISVDNAITISVVDGKMSIQKGAESPLGLNNSNVIVVCPNEGCFVRESTSLDETDPENITVNFALETRTSSGQIYSQNFYTVKYLKK